MQWGEELKAFRQRSGLKQQAAAHLLDVSQAYVSRLENGAATPSPDLEARLRRLLTEPAHRPLYDHVRALITYSPYAVSLISERDGKIVVEAASRALLETAPFKGLEVGGVMNIDLGAEANGIIDELLKTGAFAGDVAYAEVLWTYDGKDGETSHWRTVQTPLKKDAGDWVLCASNVEISAEEKARLVKAWGGPMRATGFDEAPPPPIF